MRKTYVFAGASWFLLHGPIDNLLLANIYALKINNYISARKQTSMSSDALLRLDLCLGGSPAGQLGGTQQRRQITPWRTSPILLRHINNKNVF